MTVMSRTGSPLLRHLGQTLGVLFDRDDTLVLDVPRYSGDPTHVVPVPGARNAVARLRAAGLPVGVVSNQPGLRRGMLTVDQLTVVHRRVEQLVGAMDSWRYCSHTPLDSCVCRRPGPQLVLQAAADLGVPACRTAVVGDIGADILAAQSAGAVGILVPSPRTLKAEIRHAPLVAQNLGEAVDLILSARSRMDQ